jgi:GT2 family glycosyltransferase
MSIRADIVTVYHNDANYLLHTRLREALALYEPDGGYRFLGVDNRTVNRGFARACNLGAFHPNATAPIIGFLNPDVEVRGPFLDAVEEALTGNVVVTGCRYAKPRHELEAWGVADWVCGAALFVLRDWFTSVGGFDEQFTWAWEETDLIRQAETAHLACRSIALPIDHQSPATNSRQDEAYKRYHFAEGQKRFYRKWGRVRA